MPGDGGLRLRLIRCERVSAQAQWELEFIKKTAAALDRGLEAISSR